MAAALGSPWVPTTDDQPGEKGHQPSQQLEGLPPAGSERTDNGGHPWGSEDNPSRHSPCQRTIIITTTIYSIDSLLCPRHC